MQKKSQANDLAVESGLPETYEFDDDPKRMQLRQLLHPEYSPFQKGMRYLYLRNTKFSEGAALFHAFELDLQTTEAIQVDDLDMMLGCEDCKASPVKGRIYHCSSCKDFDLCPVCYPKLQRLNHPSGSIHEFIQIPSDECIAKWKSKHEPVRPDYRSPLHEAASNGDFTVVDAL